MSADLGSFLGRICTFLGVEPFPPQSIERFGGQRHWVGPSWPETEHVARIKARLREYHAPYNACLFDMLGHEWE